MTHGCLAERSARLSIIELEEAPLPLLHEMREPSPHTAEAVAHPALRATRPSSG